MDDEKQKGWTHPRHWKMAIVATMFQTLSVGLACFAVIALPTFKSTRFGGMRGHNLISMDMKCENTYCYDSKAEKTTDFMDDLGREFVGDVKGKMDPQWLMVARAMICIGVGVSCLSLFLELFIFWPLVMSGKVINILLEICRVIDFLGAPLKPFGVLVILLKIHHINTSYSWDKYNGLFQVEPLPLGLVLFSYVCQTLCMMFNTIAADKGALGQPTHLEVLAAQKAELEEAAAAQALDRRESSYHPLDTERSSRLLADVEEHFSKYESNV